MDFARAFAAMPRYAARPTWENGIRFRSRLEARWARYFAAAGVPFEYEPDWFRLESGLCYKPDFWLLLPGGCWAEVKPLPFNRRELAKLRGLTRATRRPAFLLIGEPAAKEYGRLEWIPPAERWFYEGGYSLGRGLQAGGWRSGHALVSPDGRMAPVLAGCRAAARARFADA